MAVPRLQEELLEIQRRTLLEGRRGKIAPFTHMGFAFPYVTEAVLNSFKLRKKEHKALEIFFQDHKFESYAPHLQLSRELGVDQTKDLLATLARKVALIKTRHVQTANTHRIRRSLVRTARTKATFDDYQDAVAQSLLTMHLKATEWHKALTDPAAAYDAVRFAEGCSHSNAPDLRAFLTKVHGNLPKKP